MSTVPADKSISKLLFVTSSLFGAESRSRQVAVEFIASWCRMHPGTSVAERDLHRDPLPHLSREAFLARSIPEQQLTDEQRTLLAHGHDEIEALEAADVIVIAAPMYNFSIASTLKTWIDHIVVAGRTFTYSEGGPRGLLSNKKVFVVSARGGFYAAQTAAARDFNEPYLRCILGFIGLTDIRFINVEGQALGTEAAASGMEQARDALRGILPATEAS